MDTVQELKMLRADLIREIDDKIGRMIQELMDMQISCIKQQDTRKVEKLYESKYSLNAGTGIFKGKKPTGILFPDGRRVDVPTWRKVVEMILQDCDSVLERHQKLMDLRGKMQGRDRVLLGSEKGTMRSPVKIADALYVETHYDTETLLRILTTRILPAVGYDYSKIGLTVRND